jgi:transcription initiation factor TFIIIB Brf1 subunit/transcription initiation factor TFIIB
LVHVDKIDEHERLLSICRLALNEEEDEEEKLKIKMEISEHREEIKRLDKILGSTSTEVNYHRLALLQSRMQTKVEKQIELNRERFSKILESFGADERLKVFTWQIWQKTLKLKLQRGRYLAPNVFACLITALKISGIRYDLYKDIISSYTPGEGDTPRWLLKKQVWSAEKLIHERVFGKTSCKINKETEKAETGLPHWLQNSCPRVDWKIPVKDHKEDIELNLRSFAENTKLKLPINPILSSAIEIFDNEEAKIIAGGKHPTTIIASVIYLALLKNNVEISYIEFISDEAIMASEAGVKRLCKAINDGLKLGIQLNF